MNTLFITWQRLVDEHGVTCDRCQTTYDQIQSAIDKLQQALQPFAIHVKLVERKLTRDEFANDPIQSNRIWIAHKSLEEWLGAQVGETPCCDLCHDSDCRTIEIDDKVYETIPEELITKAGLIAAAHLLNDRENPSSTVASHSGSCCCSGSHANQCC